MTMTSDLKDSKRLTGSKKAELAQKRAGIYHTLSVTYAGRADEALLEVYGSWRASESELPRGSLPDAMKRGLGRIGAWLDEGDSHISRERLGALESEFVKLFRGLARGQSPPPPYESVYVDSGFVYGPATDRVSRKYREFSLKGHGNEPPDHLPLELDFMRFLCEKEAEAWESKQSVDEWLSEEQAFLNEHLAQWVPALCDNVRSLSENAFYSGLADLTEGWICCDQEIIAGLRDQEAGNLVQ